MAKRERNKRSARKARQKERAELEAKHAASGMSTAAADSASQKSVKKAEASKPSKKAKDKKPGLGARISNYFKLVRTEMHKVVWPSKLELRNWSIAVIVMLVVFGVCVWAIDTGFVALLVGYTGLRG